MGKTRIAGELVNNIFINQSGTTSFTGSLRVSGSSNIIGSLNATSLTGSLSYTNLTSLPTLVSGSSQITYASISSIPSGIVSGSAQTITNLPTGTVSGSIQVLGGTGIISSSTQLENTTITNLTITNLTTVNETASVIFSSGSNRFGDFGDDTHSFTGSVKISGSITTIGNQTITGSVTATTGNGNSLNLRSGNAGHYTILGLGRTTQDLAIASAAAGGQFFVGAVAGDAWVGATNGTIGFGNDTSGVATMVVKGGNVLVNTTSVNASGLISINADVNLHQGIAIKSTGTQNGLYYVYFMNSSGGAAGSISQTSSTTVSYGTSSDYRLKEDLQDFNGLDKVSAIKVYDFKWKDGDRRDCGAMAHELQQVVPNSVVGEKDEMNEDGTIKTQQVDYSKLVPVLVKAIQELKAENDTLKERLTAGGL